TFSPSEPAEDSVFACGYAGIALPLGSVAWPFHNANTAGFTPPPNGHVTTKGGVGFAHPVSSAASFAGDRDATYCDDPPSGFVTETTGLFNAQFGSEVGSQ